MLDEVIFIEHLPQLDLHGFDRDTARIATNDFVNDNVKMKNKFIVIIHGKGSYIVRNSVHDALKKNKLVLEYKLYSYNIGCTIVALKLN